MLGSKSSSSSVSSGLQRPLCQQQSATSNQTRNRSPYLQQKYSNNDLNDIRNINDNECAIAGFDDALVSSKKYLRQK